MDVPLISVDWLIGCISLVDDAGFKFQLSKINDQFRKEKCPLLSCFRRTSSNIIQHHPTSSNIIQHHPTSSNIIQHHPTTNFGRWPLQLPHLYQPRRRRVPMVWFRWSQHRIPPARHRHPLELRSFVGAIHGNHQFIWKETLNGNVSLVIHLEFH